jgi:hypothetical protein
MRWVFWANEISNFISSVLRTPFKHSNYPTVIPKGIIDSTLIKKPFQPFSIMSASPTQESRNLANSGTSCVMLEVQHSLCCRRPELSQSSLLGDLEYPLGSTET